MKTVLVRRWTIHGARILGLFVLLALFAPMTTPTVFAATPRYVAPTGSDTTNNCSNSGSPCKTITHALTQATAGDTINIAAGTYSVANGETLPLVPTVDVTLNGTGGLPSFVDGGNATRVMTINSGRNITLQNLTITNGNNTALTCSFATFDGGGVCNLGTLTVLNNTFVNNSAIDSGGGIANTGTLNVVNSTFSGNSANKGGGIGSIGMLNVTNSTLSGNTATSQGGGIFQRVGSNVLNYFNTIVANSPSGGDIFVDTSGCFPFCAAGSSANNLVMDGSGGGGDLTGDPKLYPLASNGGATQTMALKSDSPAIDMGQPNTCAASPVNGLDQRGQPRNDLACDIGAYESQMGDRNNSALTPSTLAMTTYGPARVGIQDNATGIQNNPGVITATKVITWTGGTPANTLGAWWELTAPTNTGLSLDLKLCYSTAETGNLNESGAHFWRYSGGSWSDVGAAASFSGATPNRCAQIGNVTALSRWTLSDSNGPGGGNAPTAVSLSSFRASAPSFNLWQWLTQIWQH